jgi:hypothetical protein
MGTNGMTPAQWVDAMRTHYLDDFVLRGGASVKFAVMGSPDPESILANLIRGAAHDSGYYHVTVDARTVKLHMIDKVFFEVAGQIDWHALSHRFVKNLFAKNGYKLPEVDAPLTCRAIAELNEVEEKTLSIDFRKWLKKDLFNVLEMSQEFRVAMMRLCIEQVDDAATSDIADSIILWLRGELRLISAVKGAFIYQRIGRHNARHMLFSLAYWLHLTGAAGLSLTLDITRYSASRVAGDPSLFYGPSVVLDAYELLRQFIDATDELNFCLVTVLAAPEFLSDERRGVKRYRALDIRIANEVRDAERPNPLAALTRVE